MNVGRALDAKVATIIDDNTWNGLRRGKGLFNTLKVVLVSRDPLVDGEIDPLGLVEMHESWHGYEKKRRSLVALVSNPNCFVRSYLAACIRWKTVKSATSNGCKNCEKCISLELDCME